MRRLFGIAVLTTLAAGSLFAGTQTQGIDVVTVPDQQSANEVRGEFQRILRQQPSTVAEVLRVDPGLMQNAEFLRPYPSLAAFIAQHPEVPRSPAYFVGTFRGSNGISEELAIVAVFATIGGVIIWLVRTLIDYRRWSRLSRIQTDVHTKLLDRFANSQELQAYFESSAGRRFLEAAPIPLEGGVSAPGAPMNRIMWSLQAGLVLALGGGGLRFAVPRMTDQSAADPMNVLGAIAIALGIGFILSAISSIFLSRRLGLIGEPKPASDGSSE